MNYLASPPLVVAYALAGRMDIDLVNEPLGEGADGEPVYLRDIWPTPARDPRHDRAGRASPTCSRAATPTCTRATSAGTRSTCRRATSTTGASPPTSKRPPYFDGMPAGARAGRAGHRRARAGAARRQRHDRPHLARRRDPAGQPGRALPDRARRRAARLQLVRLTPRQPRGDDARHVRERAPAQPARAGHRRALDGAPARAASR